MPASELHADVIAEEDAAATPNDDSDRIISATDGVEYTLVDEDSGNVVVRSSREVLDENARQTLTMEEIEELKREGAGAGMDLVAKLMLSHTALDQKTSYSLAKYKLLKTKKYIKRFQILPLDIFTFANYHLEEKDAARILDIRQEMMGLVGCYANVHYGGDDVFLGDAQATSEDGAKGLPALRDELLQGRWLVVDDVCGLLVGAMAERMGILQPVQKEMTPGEANGHADTTREAHVGAVPINRTLNGHSTDAPIVDNRSAGERTGERKPRQSDLTVPYSQTNTLTLVHSANQPGLSFLNYYGYDSTDPNPMPHPLVNHLLTVSWLQLVKPELDMTYSSPPPTATPAQLEQWKPGRRGNFHRKRRRWARIHHAVDAARAGHFSGLVTASMMDPVSILRHTLPLLAGGAPVAIYAPSLEPLAELADCFSVARRSAWASAPPAGAAGRTQEELERWQGDADFPLNPTLLLGVGIHTSRARPWQVLPQRTHPMMTSRGGAEGYVFTGWRAKPAEGKVAARGKFVGRKRKQDDTSGPGTETPGTPA